MKWWVELVESPGDVVVKRLGPFPSERMAEKCERGVNINLNHERFYTRTVRK